MKYIAYKYEKIIIAKDVSSLTSLVSKLEYLMIDFMIQPKWLTDADDITIEAFVIHLDLNVELDAIESIKNIKKLDDNTYEYSVLALV